MLHNTPVLKKTNPQACSVHLQNGPRTELVYMQSQQGGRRPGCWGRRCKDASEQDCQTKPEPMLFLKTGQTTQDKNYHASVMTFLYGAQNLDITVDLYGQSRYPEVIHGSEIWLDILHWQVTKKVVLVELTVPWESRIKSSMSSSWRSMKSWLLN